MLYPARQAQQNVKLNGCSLEGERHRGLGVFGDMCFFNDMVSTLALATIYIPRQGSFSRAGIFQ